MPKFKVTTPDGVTFDVNAPEGSTQDDAIRYVQENLYKSKAQDIPSPAQNDPYKDVAQEQSFMENALAGAGGAMKGLYLGAKQSLGMANQSDIDAHRRAMSGLRSTWGGTLGEIAGTALPAAATAAIPGANTYTGAALTGAALSALQPLAADENRALEAAKGGALGAVGQGAANVIGRVLRPNQATPTPQLQDLSNKAKQIGMSLSAAQETGSKPLKWIDSTLDSMPFTAEKQAAQKQAQRDVWQRKLLESAGDNTGSTSATPDVMGRIKDALGAEFQRITGKYYIPVDNVLLTKLSDIEAKYGKRLTTNQRQIVQSYIDDLTSSPVISGQTYGDARSMLKRQSDGMRNSDPFTADILREIRQSIDDAMNRTIAAGADPADIAAWTKVNKNYSVMKNIAEKSADTNTGNISALKFFNELERRYPEIMKYGKGPQDVADLARVGKAFIADTLPNSGSQQRLFAEKVLTGSGLAGVGAFLTGAIPPVALVAAATGAATPLAVQKALWSNSGLLREGLLSPRNLERAKIAARALTTAAPIGLLSEVGK